MPSDSADPNQEHAREAAAHLVPGHVLAGKDAGAALYAVQEYAEAIVQTMPDALLVLDTDLRVKFANDAFYTTFQVQRRATENTLVYELGNGQWNIPALRLLLETVLPENKTFTGYTIDHEFAQVGRRVLLLNGRRLDHLQLILLVMADITAARQSAAARAVAELAQDVLAAGKESERRMMEERLETQVTARTAQVRELATCVTMSEHAERRHLAAILHEDLQQRLFSFAFQLAALRLALAATQTETAQQLIGAMEEALRGSIQLTRELSVDLSPPVLHGEGLAAAVQWLATQMGQQQGLTVDIEAEQGLPPLGENMRVLLFQTVRELLFNVVKHAGVKAASVQLVRAGEYLRVEVGDRGRGFAPGAAGSGATSQGLRLIEQKMQLLGGSMAITSARGQGTQVALFVPLQGTGGSQV